MKYSTKLSDAVHILIFIAVNPDYDLSSASIAKSVKTNPAFVRQIMMKLKSAGLIESVVGHAKPTLAKQPERISLLDVYKAVEGDKPLLHLDTHVNPECGVGINIQLALEDYYKEIQKTTENHMAKITMRDIIDSYNKKIENFPSG